MLVTFSHLNNRLEPSQVVVTTPALPANVRLGWKRHAATNDLAYCDTGSVKRLRAQAVNRM